MYVTWASDVAFRVDLPPAKADPAAAGGLTPAKPEGEPGEAEKRPVKEKTFFEKNWMFIAAAGMLMMNVLNKAPAAPAPGVGGGAAPGGARTAAPR